MRYIVRQRLPLLLGFGGPNPAVSRQGKACRQSAGFRWGLCGVLIPLLTSLAGEASALELPVPEKLEREYGVQRQTIEVVEPHASTPDQPKRVRYVALPLDGLLRRWFDASWQAPDAEIVFLARDGYRSTIPGSRLMNHRAYLAFARVDGNAFVVDNLEQNEKGVPLGPYYLIWDNRSAPDLLPLGSSGWPYQVTRIELHSAAEDRRLLPTSPSPDIISGFEDTKEHCLNCHRIRGVGGEKYAEDLVRAACRWHDNDLKSWIGDPRQFRPATAMPPLNPQLPAEARRELIERIAAYLVAVKADDPAACAGASVKP